jgi:hypothetical protein
VWSAVHKSPDGRHIRVLVARGPDELSAKISDAEDGDGLPEPGVAHPSGGWISGPSS